MTGIVSSLVVLAVLAASPATAATADTGSEPPGEMCLAAAERYAAARDHGNAHQGVGATQANYNGTNQTATSTFTSQVTGTVTQAYTADVTANECDSRRR